MSQSIISREQLLSDPSYFLWRIDVPNRRLLFLKVDEETFRGSVFLDDRIAHERTQVLSVALEEVS